MTNCIFSSSASLGVGEAGTGEAGTGTGEAGTGTGTGKAGTGTGKAGTGTGKAGTGPGSKLVNSVTVAKIGSSGNLSLCFIGFKQVNFLLTSSTCLFLPSTHLITHLLVNGFNS